MTNKTDKCPPSWTIAGALVLVAIVQFWVLGDQHWAMGAVSMVSISALAVFYLSKTPGFGPFTVSTLILLLALSLTAILAVAGKVAKDDTTSILLAVIGFASGLFAAERITGRRKRGRARRGGGRDRDDAGATSG